MPPSASAAVTARVRAPTLTGDPLRHRRPHQLEPRVAEQRRAGIAHQRHPRTLAPASRAAPATRCVSLWACRDSSGLRAPAAAAARVRRVSSAAIRSALASASRARGAQIPHVADRSGDDVEPARLIAHYNPLYAHILPSKGKAQQPMPESRRFLHLAIATVVALLGLQLASCAAVQSGPDQAPPGILTPCAHRRGAAGAPGAGHASLVRRCRPTGGPPDRLAAAASGRRALRRRRPRWFLTAFLLPAAERPGLRLYDTGQMSVTAALNQATRTAPASSSVP